LSDEVESEAAGVPVLLGWSSCDGSVGAVVAEFEAQCGGASRGGQAQWFVRGDSCVPDAVGHEFADQQLRDLDELLGVGLVREPGGDFGAGQRGRRDRRGKRDLKDRGDGNT
jgi:hypothetical protein